ncbi:hypothetical protein BDR07DRAFT_1372506 [Suillus spraguei]|nr:hypothetical protein BDR07DRAFT_1372506 [Suillus spraguei]
MVKTRKVRKAQERHSEVHTSPKLWSCWSGGESYYGHISCGLTPVKKKKRRRRRKRKEHEQEKDPDQEEDRKKISKVEQLHLLGSSVLDTSQETSSLKSAAVPDEKVYEIQEVEDTPCSHPQISDLLKAMQDGPVIMLITSKQSCDAIIISNVYPKPLHVQLKLSFSSLAALSTTFQACISSVSEDPKSAEDQLKEILCCLWDNVMAPVIAQLKEKIPPGHSITLKSGGAPLCFSPPCRRMQQRTTVWKGHNYHSNIFHPTLLLSHHCVQIILCHLRSLLQFTKQNHLKMMKERRLITLHEEKLYGYIENSLYYISGNHYSFLNSLKRSVKFANNGVGWHWVSESKYQCLLLANMYAILQDYKQTLGLV